MKVILYIGHHKVGSTALQAFLAQNWLPLAKSGILYPAVESQGFATNLAKTLGRPQPKPPLPVTIREPHSALAYRMIADAANRPIPKQFQGLPATPQMLRALRKQVAALSPHTVILCSEAFANFGQVAQDQIDRLCRVFEGADFHVYCALRRPDAYLTSWHGQRLKVGELAQPLAHEGAKQYYNSIHFDYRMVVEAWHRHVPNAQLSVRNYADVMASGGSAQDFIAQTGLQMPEGIQQPGRANSSLPTAAFGLMEQAIKDLDAPLVHQLSRYLQTHSKALTPIANKDIELFGALQRQALIKDFTPVENYLRDLTGQAAFFPDLDDIASPRPISSQDAARQVLACLEPQNRPAALPDKLSNYLQKLTSRL